MISFFNTLLMETTLLLAMSATQTDKNQQTQEKSIHLLRQLPQSSGAVHATNRHTCTRNYKPIHRQKYIHGLDVQRAHTRLPLWKHRAREAADTMECLSMQETLCLGGRGALKESAEGHPTSPWTEPVPRHQREKEPWRQRRRKRGGGGKRKDKDRED